MLTRYKAVLLVVLFCVALVGHGFADGGGSSVDVEVIVNESHKDFHFAIRTHYKTSDKAIGLARKKKIKDDELPVLFHLSARAKVKPEVVMNLRIKGMSWAQITLHLGMGADIYYVPLKAEAGPPYGKAYGHFKKRPRSEWNRIILADVEIVDLVNLRFMSEHHGFSADEVVKIRAKHRDFFSFHATLKKEKEKRHASAKSSAGKGDKGSGKGKGGEKKARGKGTHGKGQGAKSGAKGKSGKKGKG